jgi:hypothetical protein
LFKVEFATSTDCQISLWKSLINIDSIWFLYWYLWNILLNRRNLSQILCDISQFSFFVIKSNLHWWWSSSIRSRSPIISWLSPPFHINQEFTRVNMIALLLDPEPAGLNQSVESAPQPKAAQTEFDSLASEIYWTKHPNASKSTWWACASKEYVIPIRPVEQMAGRRRATPQARPGLFAIDIPAFPLQNRLDNLDINIAIKKGIYSIFVSQGC